MESCLALLEKHTQTVQKRQSEQDGISLEIAKLPCALYGQQNEGKMTQFTLELGSTWKHTKLLEVFVAVSGNIEENIIEMKMVNTDNIFWLGSIEEFINSFIAEARRHE